MHGGEFKFNNFNIYITRSGYTGEDGFEVSIPNEIAENFTKFLLDNGSKLIGLGARDTLRLEAGLCLYGNDIDIDTTPIEANLKWAISKKRIDDQYPGSEIIKKKYIKSPQWLRNIKTAKPSFWKFYKPRQPQLIYDGGWHFSFLKNPKGISKKIQSYSHSEYNKSIYTDEKKIAERINNRIDIFDRNFKYEKIDIDDTFPKYILENLSKYSNRIIQ